MLKDNSIYCSKKIKNHEYRIVKTVANEVLKILLTIVNLRLHNSIYRDKKMIIIVCWMVFTQNNLFLQLHLCPVNTLIVIKHFGLNNFKIINLILGK